MADPRHTMSRKYTGAEISQGLCFQMMRDFSYEKRTESVIWAAKYRECPTCHAGVGIPCKNMADIRANKVPRLNKQPHPERIDWGKLRDALKARGYGG